jgi:TctA family transporter
MEILNDLVIGLTTALEFQNLFYCFVGVLLGTLIGVLPGVGPTATIAMLLPITFSLSPASAMIMLAGIYYGAQYGGSTTAILMNLPGEASAVVTAIDGYKMARNGRAGPALAIAAIGSFVAGTVATLVIALLAPALTAIALDFGAAEYFSLIVFGLVCSVALAHGSILKALAMIVLGLLLGLVGTDVYTGAQRFTLGFPELFDGVNVVALAVGVFGIAEILRNLEDESDASRATVTVGRLVPSREDLRRSAGPIARGTLIGSMLGILPGGGALLSSFASYTAEKKLSKTPERFGHGAIEGVAGPESANNAGAQTSFIPMLTLGIPSNAVMALMIGALILQGVVPGPAVVTDHPDLFWGLIASMWVGNAMLVILNLPLVGLWVRLLAVPYNALFPAIIAFSVIGIYSVNSNAFDLYSLSLFGIAGYFLIKIDCEPAPLLLGFVLSPLFEEHLRRAMILSRGDPSVFITSPISAIFLVMALLMLVAITLPAIGSKRGKIFVESD